MNKEELLFYNAYEDFYKMAGNSMAFRDFCREAFGEDFSQDGFSDINQINMILEFMPKKKDLHIFRYRVRQRENARLFAKQNFRIYLWV